MTRRAKIMPDYDQIVRDNYQKALTLDAMPSDGQRNRRGTEFQLRRHKQIEFLQELWPLFFLPIYPVLNYVDLADVMGAIPTDSVGDALYVFAETAKHQHIGRGVIKKDINGKQIINKETNKPVRTPRKIHSTKKYLISIARATFKGQRKMGEDEILV